jgi:hypothetical protein
VRAPDSRRKAIAEQIVKWIAPKPAALPEVEQSLSGVAAFAADPRIVLFSRLEEYKQDMAKLRPLLAKWKGFPGHAALLREIEFVNHSWTKFDPRSDALKFVCAMMARGELLGAGHRRLGKRFNRIARLYYEYATGRRLKATEFDRACRTVQKQYPAR